MEKRKQMSEKRIFTTKDFIEAAKKVHGNKYDYSKTTYVGRHKKLLIICKEHGEFWQIAGNHLRGAGCPVCKKSVVKEKLSDTKESFIEKAVALHGNKYDYSKIVYIDSQTKVCIVCPEHGEFWQKPNNHLNGYGCKKCGIHRTSSKERKTKEEFIENAKHIHGDKYDYSEAEYITSKHKLKIICPEHGEFWQTPNNHLHGWGCKKCSESHLEKEVIKLLDELGLDYNIEKTFSWLRFINPLYLDFYIPSLQIAIECQGSQHFIPATFGSKKDSGEEMLKMIQKRDEVKKRLCTEHGVKLLYYTKMKIKENKFETFFDLPSLKCEIQKMGTF